MLRFIARELRESPYMIVDMIVVGFRKAETEPLPAAIIADPNRIARQIPLRSLNASEVGEVVQRVMQQGPMVPLELNSRAQAALIALDQAELVAGGVHIARMLRNRRSPRGLPRPARTGDSRGGGPDRRAAVSSHARS